MTFRTKGGSKAVLRIDGGSQRLPEAVTKMIKRQPFINKVVSQIDALSTGVIVKCSDGSVFRSKYCVCTLPFSSLKSIKISPKPSSFQNEAIQKLQYTQITQFHIGIKNKFWEKDELPINMWTDAKVGRFFGDKGANGVENFLCWTNGLEAITLDKLSEKKAAKTILDEMSKIRPSTKDNIEILKVISWGKNIFNKGAYSHFAPGQVNKFVKNMYQPINNLHFAGEHTALINSGMEGALESAERVGLEILNKA
jgi:monoamine oxidase